jgi:uncharacterized membrane protein YuzA (DUF378 family)
MFGSRFLLSLAAFAAGSVLMLGLISWNVVEPLHPGRLGTMESIFYGVLAGVPAVFWFSIFFRQRAFARRF